MPTVSTQTRRTKKIFLIKKPASPCLNLQVWKLMEENKKLKKQSQYELRTKISKWMSDPKTQGEDIYDFLCDECGCKMDDSNWTDDDYI